MSAFKKIIIACIIVTIVFIFFSYSNDIKTEAKIPNISQEKQEELYQDIIITLMSPQINEVIKNYYGKSYRFEIWDTKILDIQRPNGDRTAYFIIKVQVSPFTGPHNSVGLDEVTLEVASGAEAKVLKFDHIKD